MVLSILVICSIRSLVVHNIINVYSPRKNSFIKQYHLIMSVRFYVCLGWATFLFDWLIDCHGNKVWSVWSCDVVCFNSKSRKYSMCLMKALPFSLTDSGLLNPRSSDLVWLTPNLIGATSCCGSHDDYSAFFKLSSSFTCLFKKKISFLPPSWFWGCDLVKQIWWK